MTSKAWKCPPAFPPVLSYVLPIPEAADWNLPQGLSTASAAHSQPTQGCLACFFLPPLGLNLSGRSLDSLRWFTLSTNPFPPILRPSPLHRKPTTEHRVSPSHGKTSSVRTGLAFTAVCISLPRENKLRQNGLAFTAVVESSLPATLPFT